MSERLSLQDILREYGIPLVQLDVTADREQLVRLRDNLKGVTTETKQGYLEVNCSFFVDIHDIDRYLSGELPNLSVIYAFPDDVKVYEEGM